MNIKPRGPKSKKGPWNLVGYVPLGGPCGRATVWRHYKAELQVLSSVDTLAEKDGMLAWHVSVSSFPKLGAPDEKGVAKVRADFAMEGGWEDPPVHNKSIHLYLPATTNSTETTQ